ncbi:unnamed protein product [Pocillopora meandrina]|uniref:Apple domain-containing protein n=1 Tax=Pocillopora meandrina TaxID=46732 RepID=A0AAU9XPP3_9CNID|nr:unnamed protein product [Pocillopora meandrina]
MVFKFINNLAPDYLANKFKLRSCVHDWQTRSASTLDKPFCCLSTGQRSFAYRGAKLCNSLSSNLNSTGKKNQMNFFLCGVLVGLLISEVEVSQAILCKEASLSCPVITRNHRRLKGFTFKTFHLASLISCGLLCQRDPRCVSTNFRNVFKSEGTCELNDRGALLTEKGNELEYDEEAIYTQFYDTKVTKKS